MKDGFLNTPAQTGWGVIWVNTFALVAFMLDPQRSNK